MTKKKKKKKIKSAVFRFKENEGFEGCGGGKLGSREVHLTPTTRKDVRVVKMLGRNV